MCKKLKYEKPQFDITRFEIKQRLMTVDYVGMDDDNDGNIATTEHIGSVPDPGELNF